MAILDIAIAISILAKVDTLLSVAIVSTTNILLYNVHSSKLCLTLLKTVLFVRNLENQKFLPLERLNKTMTMIIHNRFIKLTQDILTFLSLIIALISCHKGGKIGFEDN